MEEEVFEIANQKTSKFSYSKLNTYESCPYRYKLQYVDHHFIDTSSIANEFGTLIHYIEESIARDIVANNHEPTFMIDFDKYIDIFINAGTDDSDVQTPIGARKIKEKYPEEFYTPDKYGFSYDDKANNYLNSGIYRLSDYLSANRNLKIIGVEIPFDVEYEGFVFHGFIDRVFKDDSTGNFIIEDIKTWQDIKGHDLVTPLQFVFYTKAAQKLFDISEDNISCYYDLPLANERFAAGTKGYMKRGAKKIDKLLHAIEAKEFVPKPTPLCYWCSFSDTCPNQPEEGKNLCPYRSNWTKDNRNFSVEFEWMGEENHEAILSAYIDKHAQKTTLDITPRSNTMPIDRIRIARRL